MLNIKDFHVSDDCMFYEGINHYYIYQQKDHYIMIVSKLIDDGENTKETTYHCSGLNTAMETIELLENGAEI
ncbi:MAG: hypothetical protein IJT36_08925 [Alphaproteobacteria bacterium]|nr:hypothetical protein [Alphaproteobacteria bacterium]